MRETPSQEYERLLVEMIVIENEILPMLASIAQVDLTDENTIQMLRRIVEKLRHNVAWRGLDEA